MENSLKLRMSKPREYSIDDKLAGRDLHGLSCRIPEPTSEQAQCSHSEEVSWDDGYENDWTGEWVSDWKQGTKSLMEDIPGTNNMRCTCCGYTRRY